MKLKTKKKENVFEKLNLALKEILELLFITLHCL